MADAGSDQHALLLDVGARLTQMEKAFDRAAGVVKTRSKQMENSATSLEKFFGKPSLARALDKTFDATRFKILDSGVARVGIFGSALEALGPAGLAAAAGIGAAAAAFVQARQAVSFADELSDTADRLHVTTDALQEYRYAVRAAGGEEKGADEALEKFSTNLGLAQAGLKKGQRAFLELGFSQAQIKGFTDADTALKAVVERIAGLSDVQQDAVIKQLGLEGIKPLIDDGVDSMQALRLEAHAAGLVMDADLVKRGAALNDQFETASKVIDVQLKSAFVDLAPVLLQLLGLMADMAKLAAGIADSFRAIENKSTGGLTKQRDALLAQSVQLSGRAFNGDPVAQGILKRNDELLKKIDAQLGSRTAAGAAAPVTPTRTLIDPSGGGGRGGGAAARDDTVQRSQKVMADLDNAEKAILQELLSVASSAEARANLQKQIVDRETAVATGKIDRDIAETEADKGILPAKRAELAEQLKIVRAKTIEAADLEKAAIDREAAQAAADQALRLQDQKLDGEVTLLSLQQSLATSDGERARIAERLVALAYQRERTELQGIIDSKTASDADKALARVRQRQLDAAQPAVAGAARAQALGQSAGGSAGLAAFGPGAADQSPLSDKFNADAKAAIDASVTARQALATDEAERTRIAQEGSDARARIDQSAYEARMGFASDFFGNLASLSGSSNKTLAAIGKAAAITQATIDGVLAVQRALAAFPPPWNFAAAAAVGTAAAVNVAKIAGFEGGGFTGGREGQVAGLVHGEEFVANAAATRRNRPLLEAINAGADLRRLLPSGSLPGGTVGGSSSSVSHTFAPTLHVSVSGAAAANPGRTGHQIAAATLRNLDTARQRGFARG